MPPLLTTLIQIKADSSYPTIENNAQKPQEVNRQSDSLRVLASRVSSSSESTINQEGERSSIPTQGLNKQQQQHLHFPPIYGNTGGNFHPYSGTNVNSLTSSVKPQPHDAQVRQISQHEIMSLTQLSGTTQGINTMDTPKFQRQNSINDLKRVQGGSTSHLANSSTSQHILVPRQSSTNKEQSSTPSPSMAGVKQESLDQLGSRIASAASPARTPSKKPSIGQKKPLDTLGSSQPLPSKKQKDPWPFRIKALNN